MQPVAFCCRCRGMKVGWNRKYALHCLVCKGWVWASLRSLSAFALVSFLIFAFPTSTELVFSNLQGVGELSDPLVPAPSDGVVDPAVAAIDHLLSRYGVHAAKRERIAQAVVHSSRMYNVDPRLVTSVMIVESRANPLAISDAESVGIMQIHLPTWGDTIQQENINLFRIEDNVDFGVRILSGYIRRYGLRDAVRRYNGWSDSAESQAQADVYADKVMRIYQDHPIPSTDPKVATGN